MIDVVLSKEKNYIRYRELTVIVDGLELILLQILGMFEALKFLQKVAICDPQWTMCLEIII